ncbi:hypothetical protein ANCDUO_20347, partial [Ancylostoma duodenale]
MGILSIVLTILSCSTLAQTIFTQSAGVKGVLLCGDKPLANTKVKLYEFDRGRFSNNSLGPGLSKPVERPHIGAKSTVPFCIFH